MHYNYNITIFIFITFVITIVFAENLQVSSTENDDDDGRILNGRPALPAEYPYQVSIQKIINRTRTSKFCGGVILSKRWILTAAHCFDNKTSKEFGINAGSTDAYLYSGNSKFVRMEEKFIHPNYSETETDNDIALIKLKKPLTFNKFIQPIWLPSKNYVATGYGDIIGWGKIDIMETVRTRKLMVAKDVAVSDDQECIKHFPSYNADTMLCIGANDPRNVCTGDSGGPFIQYVGSHKKPKVIGITSYGASRCDSRPAVFTKVARFRNFIEKTIQNNS